MRESTKNLLYKILQGTIVVFAIIFSYVKWDNYYSSFNSYGHNSMEERDSERNERSSPRSFILPATPGVAFQQERENNSREGPDQIAKCADMLRNLGYRIDGNETLLNPKLIEAIYTFQVDHNLPATGKIDQATRRLIKCT